MLSSLGAVLIPEDNPELVLHLLDASCPSPRVLYEDGEPIMAKIREDETDLFASSASSATTTTNAALLYEATERLAIPHCHVHAAVQETHDWYDKFACYLTDLRQGGARNPSPPSTEQGSDDEEDEGIVPHQDHHDGPLAMGSYAGCKKRFRGAAKLLTQGRTSPLATLFKPLAVRPPDHQSSKNCQHFHGIPTTTVHQGAMELSPMMIAPTVIERTRNARTQKGDKSRAKELTSSPKSRPVLIRPIPERPPMIEFSLQTVLQTARDSLLHALIVLGGETDDFRFQECLAVLNRHYLQTGADVRNNNKTEGTWLTLTKPLFRDCLGENDQGDPLYTLGRMGFDMFSPTDLVCSLQGNFNSVQAADVVNDPKVPAVVTNAAAEGTVGSDNASLCSYKMLAAFTMEPPLAAFENAPNRDIHSPVRGIMSTEGYILPDPVTPNRHSVWITSGRMEPNDCSRDQVNWKRFFTNYFNPTSRASFERKAKQVTSKLMLDVDIHADAESMEYRFRRPLGGHGAAYVDTLYLDDSLRIAKGHRGTIFVFSRLSSTGSV
jgi:hypothetical protein